tara:strand:- start:1697 stop:2503 length:807 start_codon:yes stop_codon:yes gene_type:complete
MLKLVKKVKFSKNENRMKNFGNVEERLKYFRKGKNKNLYFVLKKRFNWMNKYIKENDIGLEVGSGPGFSKDFIYNKNLKTSDFGNHQHLDFKNIDAHDTKFKDNSFDFVIAAHVLHHIPYPIKFFKEMHRILKKDGKLIIHEGYLSVLLQFIIIIMKHEGFDWTKNIWEESVAAIDDEDLWSGNNAIPNLLFDNKSIFNKNLGSFFKIEYDEILHCFTFLNSGGVTSKTFYIPLNYFFLNLLDKIDYIFTKSLPKIFAMNRRLILKKM